MDLINGKKLSLSLLKGSWIYFLILWVYIVADMFVFPQYQFGSISLYVQIPQDLIATIAFPASFITFVAWEYLRSHQLEMTSTATSLPWLTKPKESSSN